MANTNSFDDLKKYQDQESKTELKVDLLQTIQIFRSMNYSTGHALSQPIDSPMGTGAKQIDINIVKTLMKN